MNYKYILYGISSFLALIVLTFILKLTGLGFFKFFEPKRENIRREVFENTKSYTHGKIQTLSKYYKEYNSTQDKAERQALQTVIQVEFAEFDETFIKSYKLRQFLIQTRGY